jgi:hypothetical protein
MNKNQLRDARTSLEVNVEHGHAGHCRECIRDAVHAALARHLHIELGLQDHIDLIIYD